MNHANKESPHQHGERWQGRRQNPYAYYSGFVSDRQEEKAVSG